MARRTLSSAMPVLVADGAWTQEQAKEISFLGYQGYALGRVLAIPALITFGHKGTMLLNLAVICMATMGFVLAGMYGGVHALRLQKCCWFSLRILTAMTLSTMLPLVRDWFPRGTYGRVWGFLNSAIQTGYLTASFFYAHRIRNGSLPWQLPFLVVSALAALQLINIWYFLREAPDDTVAAAPMRPVVEKAAWRPLLAKLTSRRVFWQMVVAVAAYAPLVEYSTYVTNYLKEMSERGLTKLTARQMRTLTGAGGSVARSYCMGSELCEGRYRGYVAAYVSSLLIGSAVYDRCSQLDKAIMVTGSYAINIACWAVLALTDRVEGLESEEVSEPGMISLSSGTKTALVATAVASIAIPSSLPFAMFSLDFGKEGAAVLSSIITAVGFFSSMGFLSAFPRLKRRYGWAGVHASCVALGSVAAVAMSSIMFSDQRKFARGYIIRSSLLNETVVTLHACSRPECEGRPMWRPGAMRRWTAKARASQPPFRLRPLYVPNRRCDRCGRASVLECKVVESFVELAVTTPFAECNASGWVREMAPLRKAHGGWEHADPTRFPLAPAPSKGTYGDRDAFERRSRRDVLSSSAAEAHHTSERHPHQHERHHDHGHARGAAAPPEEEDPLAAVAAVAEAAVEAKEAVEAAEALEAAAIDAAAVADEFADGSSADAAEAAEESEEAVIAAEDAAEATAIAAEETRIAATRAAEVAQKLAVEAHKLEALARQRTVASVRREKQRQKLEDAAAREHQHAREQAAKSKAASGAVEHGVGTPEGDHTSSDDNETSGMPTSDFD